MSQDDKKAERPSPEIVHEGDERAYDEEGVDVTLIRWMLAKTPIERLRTLQENVNAIKRLRGEELE